MAKYTVLYNPKGNNSQAEAEIKQLDSILKGDEIEYINVLALKDVRGLVGGLVADDHQVISGGDGTLHHFVNDID